MIKSLVASDQRPDYMSNQSQYPKKFSVEFFPPRSPDAEQTLSITRQKLASLRPEYFSVTFGAGGSTRDKTLETAIASRKQTGINVAPHISCIGYSTDDIKNVLMRYKENDVNHIVALRGDSPSGVLGSSALNYADQLVEFIRQETGDYFYIDVACYPEIHPQAESATEEDLFSSRQGTIETQNDEIDENENPKGRYVIVLRRRRLKNTHGN